MILVVAALREELYPEFEDLNVVITGPGKINATLNLMKALRDPAIEAVVNFGTGGSAHYKKAAMLQTTYFYQWDYVVPSSPLIADSPLIKTPTTQKKLPGFEQAICHTGDSFVDADFLQKNSGVFDMEAYALAKVCSDLALPFYCFKYVSDSGSEKAWRSSLKKCPKAFRRVYNELETMLEGNP